MRSIDREQVRCRAGLAGGAVALAIGATACALGGVPTSAYASVSAGDAQAGQTETASTGSTKGPESTVPAGSTATSQSASAPVASQASSSSAAADAAGASASTTEDSDSSSAASDGSSSSVETPAEPDEPDEPATPKPELKPTIGYALEDTALYQEKSSSSAKLAAIPVAAKVKVTKVGTSWSQVEYASTTGYVKNSALTKSRAEAKAAKKKVVAAQKAAAKKAAQERWQKPSTAKKQGKWVYKKSGKTKYRVQYRYKDGTYPTGITKIGGVTYYFKDINGHLSRSKKVRRVVQVGSKYYHVNGSSVVQKGWDVIGGSLYDFAGKYGAALQSKKRSGITLSSDGKAVMNLEASVKKKCIVLLERITNRRAAKSVQLRAAWNYTVGGGFYYTHILANPSNKSWAKRYANQMLTTRGGSCYGFAAVFAALANEIGYKNVRVVWGNVTNGNPHSAVKINGLWYDPEEHYNGYIYGIYGLSGNPSNFSHYSSRLYRHFDGSGADRGVTSAYQASNSISVVHKNGRYYGYKGTKASLTGIYKIGGKVFKFNEKHYMADAAYKKLAKASQRNAPWSDLRELLGKPKRSYTSVSCYGKGKDVVYQYAHVSVSCFKPDDGGEVVVESVSAR